MRSIYLSDSHIRVGQNHRLVIRILGNALLFLKPAPLPSLSISLPFMYISSIYL